MEKKLPGVYPGKVRKDAGNNAKMTYVGNNTEETVKNEPKEPANELNISQKINRIFKSKNYIYKADVEITLKDGSHLNKRVVGKNNLNLITMDNELIPISNIVNIEKK